jgi:hypothetical protein
MGVGSSHWLKAFDLVDRQVDLALEGDTFLLTDRLLAIHLRFERAALSEQDI